MIQSCYRVIYYSEGSIKKFNVKGDLLELQKALEKYGLYFGQDYNFYIGCGKTEKEIISEIEKCVKTGKKQRPPKYDYDKEY